MAEGNAVQPAPEAVIGMIADIAKQTQVNSFPIRIQRRNQNTPYPISIAAFDDATVEQIAHPEGWLTRLGGGGTYIINVFHPIEHAKILSPSIIVQAAGPALNELPDPSIVEELDWVGPSKMSYPTAKKLDPKAQQSTPYLSIPSPGGGAGGRSRLANADQQTDSAAPVVPPPQGVDPLRVALEKEREQLRQAMAKLDEDRHRMELELERRRRDEEMRALRTEIAAAAASKPPGDQTGGLAALIVEMNKQAQASADRLAESQRRSDERFQMMMAEQAKSAQESAKEVQATNRMLMETLLKKPAIDPVMEQLLKRDGEASSATAKVMAQMAEATGSVVQMVVGALHAVQELNAPAESDPPWLKAVKEGVKAFAAVQMSNMNMPQMAPPPAPRAPLVAVPSPAPQPPRQSPQPIPHTPPPAPAAALGDDDGSKTPAFERLIEAIKAKQNTQELAAYFLDAMENQEPSIYGAVSAANGNPLQAFTPYLQAWAQSDPQNGLYVHGLLQEVQTQYETRMAKAAEEDDGEEEQS